MTKVTIAIDAMSGDKGIDSTLPAALKVLSDYPDIELILVGNLQVLEDKLTSLLKNKPRPERLSLHHASQVVTMEDSPSKVLRSKKDSSMRVAVDLVKEGKAQACVSSGNTGALMATSYLILRTLPGIDRPAIVGLLPTHVEGQDVRILDLGANVDSSPQNLYQFAIMGSVLAKTLDSVKKPRVALLNVGSEDIKGNTLVKEATGLFAASSDINYVGYVEGDSIFSGEADVVVCDGFVGNVALKTIEGAVKLVVRHAKRAFTQSLYSKIAALISIPVLKKLAHTFDPERYNGACLIGLKGIVIKSHGGASQTGFACAIEEAIRAAKANIPQLISEQVHNALAE